MIARLIPLFCSLLVALSATAVEPIESLVGEAYGLDSDELLYKEFHTFTYKDGRIATSTVEYKRPDGTLFATKTLDFRPHLTVPAFRTEMYGGAWIEALEHLGDDRIKLIRRQGEGEPLQEKILALKDAMAADAGFNTFVQAHFSELMAGERLKFQFVAPNRLEAVKFKGERIEDSRIGDTPLVNFKVSISSFLSFLVDPLLLSYDQKTKYLIEYKGLSNIRDEKGELYKTRIRYPELLRGS